MALRIYIYRLSLDSFFRAGRECAPTRAIPMVGETRAIATRKNRRARVALCDRREIVISKNYISFFCITIISFAHLVRKLFRALCCILFYFFSRLRGVLSSCLAPLLVLHLRGSPRLTSVYLSSAAQ